VKHCAKTLLDAYESARVILHVAFCVHTGLY